MRIALHPEAELVAMDTTLRVIAMPAHVMWDVLSHAIKPTVFGDNEAMLQVIKTGRNPTMRYLARTHRVSVAWLHEVYASGVFAFKYKETKLMAADIFTKPFSNPQKWLEVIQLISIHPPKGKHPFEPVAAAALQLPLSPIPPLCFHSQPFQCFSIMADPGGDPGPDEGGWQQVQRRWVKSSPVAANPGGTSSGSPSALAAVPESGTHPEGSGSLSAPEGAPLGSGSLSAPEGESQGSGSLSAPWEGVTAHGTPKAPFGYDESGVSIAPLGRDPIGDPLPDPRELRPLLPSRQQWEDQRFSNLTFMNEFVERCGPARALDLYSVGVPAENPWSRLISYDRSPQKYQNIPDVPHLRQLASYMWGMVEFGFMMMGRNLDFLAAEGFRLDTAVSMLLDHAANAPEFFQAKRVRDAAELYVHLLTDLNIRVGNRMITDPAIEESMHEWLTEFEEAYPLSSIPPYTRALSPIHSWKNIVVMADSTSIFYYGSAKSKSAGRRVRLFEGLEKSVGPFPGANIPIRWNCE